MRNLQSLRTRFYLPTSRAVIDLTSEGGTKEGRKEGRKEEEEGIEQGGRRGEVRITEEREERIQSNTSVRL